MSRTISLALALLLVGGGDLLAQERAAPTNLSSEIETTGPVANSLLSNAAQAELAQTSTWDRVSRHALFTVGFTLVGSGFGYFASQLAYSDWDKVNDSTFSDERRTYSLTGAAIGAVAGFLVGTREVSRAPLDSRLPLYQELAGTDVILGIELENSPVATAYEAIQIMRPQWLLTRGTQQPRESGSGVGSGRDLTIVPGETTLRVYVDNSYFGDVDSLKLLQLSNIRSIRRLDAPEATMRWGGGHTHGAILVETIQAD